MQRSPSTSVWTKNPGMTERLFDLARLGWSAGRIAKDLGGPVTRNAVISKLNRHGIKLSGNLTAKRRAAGARLGHKRDADGKRTSGFVKYKSGPPPKPDKDFGKRLASVDRQRARELPPLRNSLIDLEPGECHFPYDDSKHRFCGRRKVPGIAYCIAHAALCFKSAEPPEERGTFGPAARVEAHQMHATTAAAEFVASP